MINPFAYDMHMQPNELKTNDEYSRWAKSLGKQYPNVLKLVPPEKQALVIKGPSVTEGRADGNHSFYGMIAEIYDVEKEEMFTLQKSNSVQTYGVSFKNLLKTSSYTNNFQRKLTVL